MTTSASYTKTYYDTIRSGSRYSALKIVPLIMKLVKPKSVVDVGCGTGEFLNVFTEHGIADILGLDGAYAQSQLSIPQKFFKTIDLDKSFKLDRLFDLAICLEVAEHLAPNSAVTFVKSLTQLAPVILFSAAIPGQGGTHHINEQWITYWVRLFKKNGFLPIDAIRKRIWTNPKVEVWYRQNAIIFCQQDTLIKNPALAREIEATNESLLSLVHPEVFAYYVHPTKVALQS